MPPLRLHSVDPHVTTLGPGPAVGIWVQGCALGCAECMSPGTWSADAGARADPGVMAAWLARSPHRHLTLSGGEPTDQPAALVEVLDAARSERDWLVTCYTGRRLEALRSSGRSDVIALLDRVDLLVDGPYLPGQHADLLWRGSRNQRLLPLSGRIELPAEDRSAGVDAVVDHDGSVAVVGVPPVRGFLPRFEDALGVGTAVDIRPRTFPFALLEAH